MHFVSISSLAVALATSAMAAAPSFDITSVKAGVQGIIKTNNGRTCLRNDGGQIKTGKCGLFKSDGQGGLSSPNGFLAFNGENITVTSEKPGFMWQGVELPSDISNFVYGLAASDGEEILMGPGWSMVLGETVSKPREDFVTEHLMFYESPEGIYW